ncbi:MAG: amidohydrolase family protein [Saprospiraceae bacterium]
MSKYWIGVLFCICTNINAQDKAPKWDVNNPPGRFATHHIKTSEGTWMNVDVSPDGKTIVFDLLGDIFVMPISGGKAQILRSGLAWEVQPRWSPDGKQILYTSDAGGGDNIWKMDSDGKNATQITKESFRLLNNAVWMPDGQYFVARKHFTSTRSLGAGEMWMYHISGGEGIQLTKRKNDQQDVNEPAISPDGKSLFYSEDVYPGGYFQYNKDPNNEIFAIFKYDFAKGETKKVIGSACRPQVSNKGDKIAYVRRDRTKSILFVEDLKTGRAWPIYDDLSKDQQEAWTVFGVYTGFDWMPDDAEIVIWSKGKIKRINVTTGNAVDIPFEVDVPHKFMETVQFKNDAYTDKFDVKVLRNLVTSPNGKTLVFSALGHLYVSENDGAPRRLTDEDDFESEPAFSPDGKSIVFVTWNDEDLGKIKLFDITTKNISTLSREKGIYRTPKFAPDGKEIVYRKESGNGHQGYMYGADSGIFTQKLSDTTATFLISNGENPQYSSDGQYVYFTTGGFLFGSLTKALKRVHLQKQSEDILFNTKYTTNFVVSPDDKWVAFTELYKVYVAAMPHIGQAIGLSATTKAFPVSLVAKDAGLNLHWSADSKTLHWTLGNRYFSESLQDRFTFLNSGMDTLPPLDSIGREIKLTVKSDVPSNIFALVGGNILTMENENTIENGLIVTDGNKLRYVGKFDATKIPANAKKIDITGKTVMPGLVDVHAHLGAFRDGISPQKHWQYFANLAYGVTTTHDPSVNSEITFAQSEMVKAGSMIGPRIFSTGTILYGADGDFKADINSLEDAKSAIRRTKAFGAFSVKSYNQPRREQRQQVIEAARQLGILVVPEGGSFFYHNLSMVADGHSSVEHNIPVAPLYSDVLQFWSKTKTSNTPTLIVNYGGINGEYYWYQHTNVWEKERLLKFTPRSVVDSRARHRTMVPEDDYKMGHILTSQSCKKLNDAGVNINLGAHGQLQGLGAHWELWMLQQGGMTNFEALKSATVNGAELLGMSHQIGTLTKGKLADLIVIDGNPLTDIKVSENVVFTMINGRLFHSATMTEYGKDTLSKFYWELDGAGYVDPTVFSTRCACGL